MHILLLILLFAFLHRIVRLIRRSSRGLRNGYGGMQYGYRRRRHGFGGGLFTILGLVALDRIIGGRRW